MENVMNLINLCRGHKIYLQTHNIPDPDAIGAAFGLKNLLMHFNIDSTICYDGSIDKLSSSKMLEILNIEMYADEDIADNMKKDDYIICVDSQKNAGNITDLIGNEIAAIDHHPTTSVNAGVEYEYKDIRFFGSCCTIIAMYYMDLSITPSPDVATALLYGLRMDTLQFSRGVCSEDISVFAFLHPLTDSTKLKKLEMNNLDFSDLKAYGAAIENIRVFDYLGIVHIPFDCPDSMVAIVADFILSLIEIDIAVVYCSREDGIKFSIRSESDTVDAGWLVEEALRGIGSGGGHPTMAGGRIFEKNIAALGEYPDSEITERFLRVLHIPF